MYRNDLKSIKSQKLKIAKIEKFEKKLKQRFLRGPFFDPKISSDEI